MRFEINVVLSEMTNEDLREVLTQALTEVLVRDKRDNPTGTYSYIRHALGLIDQKLLDQLHLALAERRIEQNVDVISSPLNDTERALAEANRSILAIKMYRERVGCGLKEAKDEVDAWAKNYRARFSQRVLEVLRGRAL